MNLSGVPEGRASQTVLIPLISLDEPAALEPALVGRKAAGLARLRRAGQRTPPGVVLAVGAEPSDALTTAVARLGSQVVAVRSSSPAEDGALASAAGRYLTVLNVRTAEPDLSAAVQKVRESADGTPMAVLVQPMVEAVSAGVAFGADPVTGDRDVVLISAVHGLADRLVAGSQTGDYWSVTATSATAIRSDHGAITAQQAREIASMVRTLAEIEGASQDVEWAFDAQGLQIVQCRPITALPTPPAIDLPPGSWVRDASRYPEGMTPFGLSLAAPAVSSGLTATFARCGALVERVEMRGVAGRPYLRFTPVGGRSGPPPPAVLLGLVARLLPPLRRRCRRARRLLSSGELEADIRRWVDTERAETRRSAQALATVDPNTLPDDALADHYGEVRALLERGLSIHFRLMAAHLVGVYRFIQTCEELMGWPVARAMDMLTGLSPASGEPTVALRAIARSIADDPGLVEAVTAAADTHRTGPPRPVPEILREHAPEIATRFEAWCDTYGLRTANDDPGSPALREIPGLIDGLLRDEVRHCVDDAPAARGVPERPGSSAQPGAPEMPSAPEMPGATGLPGRTAAVAAAIAALASRSAADRSRFENALAGAIAAYPIREENVLWALSLPSGLVRRAALAIGVRLAQSGVIDEAADVAMVDADTVDAAIRGQVPAAFLRPTIARAKAERAWAANHPLPDHYGDEPAPLPDLRWLPRAARFVNEALQLDAPRPRAESTPKSGALVSGHAGSPGRYTGPARIIRRPEDFPALRRGEVLVCPTTDPAWSVLFGVAGALVTDGGGILAHAAIIAREHGIPAVLGTGCATRDLADGQLVTVDGTNGVVWPASAAPRAPRATHSRIAKEQ